MQIPRTSATRGRAKGPTGSRRFGSPALLGPDIDRSLELVPAAFAGPQMANATLVDVLRPFRSQQRITALCAGSEIAGSGSLHRDRRAERHTRNLPSSSPV